MYELIARENIAVPCFEQTEQLNDEMTMSKKCLDVIQSNYKIWKDKSTSVCQEINTLKCRFNQLYKTTNWKKLYFDRLEELHTEQVLVANQMENAKSELKKMKEEFYQRRNLLESKLKKNKRLQTLLAAINSDSLSLQKELALIKKEAKKDLTQFKIDMKRYKISLQEKKYKRIQIESTIQNLINKLKAKEYLKHKDDLKTNLVKLEKKFETVVNDLKAFEQEKTSFENHLEDKGIKFNFLTRKPKFALLSKVEQPRMPLVQCRSVPSFATDTETVTNYTSKFQKSAKAVVDSSGRASSLPRPLVNNLDKRQEPALTLQTLKRKITDLSVPKSQSYETDLNNVINTKSATELKRKIAKLSGNFDYIPAKLETIEIEVYVYTTDTESDS